MDFVLPVRVAIAVLTFIIATVVIAAIGIGSPVIVSAVIVVAVDPSTVATVARVFIGGAAA
jgi:hypothetical protein